MSIQSGGSFGCLWVAEETYPDEHAAERPDEVV